MPSVGECVLQVHHDKREGVSPLQTGVRVAEFEGFSGFWLDLGKPRFGPSDVAAQDVRSVIVNQREVSRVAALHALNPDWGTSQCVNIGHPHCVTLVERAEMLERK